MFGLKKKLNKFNENVYILFGILTIIFKGN